MDSLTRSARSTSPLIILVAFSVVFAMAWERDRPQVRPRPAVSSRRGTTPPGIHAQPPGITQRRPLTGEMSSPLPARRSGILVGLRSVAYVDENQRTLAVAELVGSQLGARALTAEQKHACFAGAAAFLCGTLEEEEVSRSAGMDRDSDWAVE